MIKMAHTENHHNDSPEMNLNFPFLGSMNLYLVVGELLAFPYIFFHVWKIFPKLPTRCSRTSRGVLSMSLVLVDFSTVRIPMSIYLLLYNNCARTQRSCHVERLAVCEIFLLMFVWFKLASLFIITTLIFTPY